MLYEKSFQGLLRTCANYRERGYRLALDLREVLLEDHREAAKTLGADWWRVHTRDVQALGPRLAVEGVLLRGAGATGDVALQVQASRVLREVTSVAVPRFLF